MTNPQTEARRWDETKPEIGMKIVIVCDDGCSTSAAFIADADGKGTIQVLEAEDGWVLDENFTKGSIWFELPADYPMAFMECHDDY